MVYKGDNEAPTSVMSLSSLSVATPSMGPCAKYCKVTSTVIDSNIPCEARQSIFSVVSSPAIIGLNWFGMNKRWARLDWMYKLGYHNSPF